MGHPKQEKKPGKLAGPNTQSPRLAENFLGLHFMVQLTVTEDADARLEELGMGRVHHRILYFVHFAPGIAVSELLQALNVKHQNIQAPLRQLINEGYILSQNSVVDGRIKQLRPTSKGKKLLRYISHDQRQRIERAYDSVTPQDIESYFKVMTAMLEEDRLRWARRLAGEEDALGPVQGGPPCDQGAGPRNFSDTVDKRGKSSKKTPQSPD